MPDRSEFRATTDQMLVLLEELRGTEERKRRMPLGSSEFTAEAEAAADKARVVFRWAQMQLEMAQAWETRVARGETPRDIRLIEVEPRPLDKVLAQWREAQLRLEIARPGSDAARQAVADIERLREEYQAGHALRLVDGATDAPTG
jgi:hypothetical protein